MLPIVPPLLLLLRRWLLGFIVREGGEGGVVFRACGGVLAEGGEVVAVDGRVRAEREVEEACEFVGGARGGGDAREGGEGLEVRGEDLPGLEGFGGGGDVWGEGGVDGGERKGGREVGWWHCAVGVVFGELSWKL